MMKHGCREHRIGARFDGGCEVVECPGAPRRDNRHRTHLVHDSNEFEVVAVTSSIGVNGVHEQLARASLDCFASPITSIPIGLGSTAMCRHDEAPTRPFNV